MDDDQKFAGPEKNELMSGAERSSAPEVNRGDDKGNPEAEKQRLEHEKSMHTREDNLFEYGKVVIKNLFIFSAFFISFVLIAISFCHASPWLITLASICVLTPAVLLACLFRHVYPKNNDEEKIVKQLIESTPLSELLKTAKEYIEALIKSKK